MKKTVAVFIVLFLIAMGTMVIWGFIDKQTKEAKLQNSGEWCNENGCSPPNPSPTTSNNSSTTTPPAGNVGAPTLPEYSLADISTHKTAKDCWIAIRGGVYNVTSFLDLHPGGSDMILMVCGQDATKAYNTQGGRGRSHSSRADAELANYKIGVLK